LPLRPGDGFYLPVRWSRAMSEKLDKEKPVANMLAAFASTIAGAFAVGLPMAVAIIWVCS
jgi:hypothetical protein